MFASCKSGAHNPGYGFLCKCNTKAIIMAIWPNSPPSASLARKAIAVRYKAGLFRQRGYIPTICTSTAIFLPRQGSTELLWYRRTCWLTTVHNSYFSSCPACCFGFELQYCEDKAAKFAENNLIWIPLHTRKPARAASLWQRSCARSVHVAIGSNFLLIASGTIRSSVWATPLPRPNHASRLRGKGGILANGILVHL